MSRYVRDNKEFREKIRSLAGSGLRFPTNPDPIVIVKVDMAKLEGETINSLRAHGFNTADYPQQYEIAPKGKLPELVSGLIWWSPIIAIAVVALHWLLRGAH